MRMLTLVCCALLLSGCMSFGAAKPESPLRLHLLSLEQAPESQVLKQKITLKKQDATHQFLAVLRIEQEKVQMIALLPTGQYIFSLSFDGATLEEESFSEIDIPSQEVFSIMQFALWPEDAIRKAYQQQDGWQLTITNDSRVLSNDSGPILKVDGKVESSSFMIENLLHGVVNKFTIIIETLEESR